MKAVGHGVTAPGRGFSIGSDERDDAPKGRGAGVDPAGLIRTATNVVRVSMRAVRAMHGVTASLRRCQQYSGNPGATLMRPSFLQLPVASRVTGRPSLPASAGQDLSVQETAPHQPTASTIAAGHTLSATASSDDPMERGMRAAARRTPRLARGRFAPRRASRRCPDRYRPEGNQHSGSGIEAKIGPAVGANWL